MKPITNLPASIPDRLLAHAKARGEDFNRTLTRYAIERFLFRLSRDARHRDRFVLKGAMLFVAWSPTTYRPTGDLDLLARGSADPASMRDIVAELCTTAQPDDALVFDPLSVRVEPAREEAEYQGLRVSMLARLGNARIPVRIDLGFGDAVHPPAQSITFPCLLADLPAPAILAYPPETVVAEKFEAMVRFGTANGRLKDFNDIWAIASTFTFEMSVLAQAMTGTFTRRATALPPDIPVGLSASFAEVPGKRAMWQAFLARTPPAISPPPFDDLLDELRRFIAPVLRAAINPERARGTWRPGLGWSAVHEL